MDVRAALNARQVEVLTWIAGGCPDGVMTGSTYKTTAVALQGRRLVTVSKRRGIWSASVTDAGRYYLENGRYPDPVTPARRRAVRVHVAATQPASSAKLATLAEGAFAADVRERPVIDTRTVTAGEAVKARDGRPGSAERFINDLQEAGGLLRVSRLNGREQGVDYVKLIGIANRTGKVPVGKRIVSTARNWPELEIRLVSAIPGTQVDASPVPVPVRVARYHPVVAQFRDLRARHEVSKQHLTRTLLILQAIAAEAEHRGHTVALPADQTNGWARVAWSGSRDGHFVITVGGYAQAVRMLEIGMPSRAGWRRNHPYQGRGTYDGNTGTGRLSIELPGYGSREGRGYRWSDNSRSRLEDKLPDVLREIEIRAAEDEHRHQQHLAEKEARRRREEEAARQAELARIEKHRADRLLDEVTRWETAHRLRSYLRALRTAIESTGDVETAADARQWLAWAEQYTTSLDPLANRLPGMPERPS